MTRNHNNDDDAYSRKSFKTCDNGGAVPWSDLDRDVLFLVMRKLGVFDFFAFSGVCKSWRSFALSNRHRLMATRPPMRIGISSYSNDEKEYYQVDFEGRNLKTLRPYSPNKTCFGLTCGYFVFYNESDFWLVNPITRHELHFPNFHINVGRNSSTIKTILVFSPLINEWVFMVLPKISSKLWFCIAGKRKWNHISSTIPIIDLHAFKGKIYTLNTSCRVCELRLNPEPELTVLEIKNFPKEYLMVPAFASSDESLYVKDCFIRNPDMVMELDFGKMQWVSPKEKTKEKYNCFIINSQYGGGVKQRDDATDKCQKAFASSIWYFPDCCLNVDLINE